MNENLGEKALIWLGQEGFTIEPLKDAGFISLFRAYQPSNIKNKIALSQAVGEDKIVIASGVFLGDEDQARMVKIPAEKRIQIIKELSKVLYSEASAFKMEEDKGVLKSVTMTRFIFADGLNKDRLMNAVFGLYGMQALVLLHLSDSLGPETGSPQEVPQEHKAEPAREIIAKDNKEAPPTRVTPPPASPVSTAPPAATKDFCPNCGKEIQPTAKFCHICGAKRSV